MMKLLILILFIFTANYINAQKVTVEIKPDAVYFLEGNDSILKYQIAEKSFNGKHNRSNYIHPLYTLDGEVLTEDFPEDHPHHRGIFWAWHQFYIGDKRLGDGWEIKDFSWDVKSVTEIQEKHQTKAIQAEVLWKSPLWLDSNGNKKPFVKEITTIKVYPSKNSCREIDIQISMLALEKKVRIGGSEDEKGYGGFSQRVRLVDDITFTGSKGVIKPQNVSVKAEGWLDITGAFSKKEKQSGLTILCHPDNPGFPNPWIIRNKRSMQNAGYPFPGANSVALSDTQPTILRYRILIHNEKIKTRDIEKLYNDFKKI